MPDAFFDWLPESFSGYSRCVFELKMSFLNNKKNIWDQFWDVNRMQNIYLNSVK